jgi:hypothetical protein
VAASASCLRRAAAARRRCAAFRDREVLRPWWAARDRWDGADPAARRGALLAGRAPDLRRGRRFAFWDGSDDRRCRRTVRGFAGAPRAALGLAAGGGLPAAGGGAAGGWLLTPGGCCVAVDVGAGGAGGVVVPGGGVVVPGGWVTGGVVTGGGP